MERIAYIYQPHYKTQVFRVAVNKQQHPDTNFIVVTCSEQYNGVWKYDSKLHETCSRWVNNNTTCYEIPISECTFVRSLNELRNSEVIDKVIEQQTKWFKNEVKNRNYEYKEIPEWILCKNRLK